MIFSISHFPNCFPIVTLKLVDKSFKSFKNFFYRFLPPPAPVFFFLIHLLMKKFGHLFPILGFSNCVPELSLNMCLCFFVSSKLVVRSKGKKYFYF